MYLNLIQVAESFGVSEKTVEDWIEHEGLPNTPDRGRLLFDRTQVANWAAGRGLAARTGFLAPSTPAVSASLRLEPLLRAGGIWRDVSADGLTGVLDQVVATLPGATDPIRRLIVQRLHTRGGITFAPIGDGLAMPHPSARVALGRDSGTLALLLLREPLALSEEAPDGVPITRLFFFIAPSPRAHLDFLGKLCRLLGRGPLRAAVLRGAEDAEIHATLAEAEKEAGA
ncbi:phosphotransferase system mannitol/fructose-specifc IIA component (Ntr-type) [Opitutaceae bacterium TAV1]|nr:PTS sugar transporter subunit IIA [Opitutaceae bacterium TAV5]EIP97094.1 phosphotransferase system mannitol/fructose-specifc IIA component (Ntr-type) [Opitutaceae bacterium TAV1]